MREKTQVPQKVKKKNWLIILFLFKIMILNCLRNRFYWDIVYNGHLENHFHIYSHVSFWVLWYLHKSIFLKKLWNYFSCQIKKKLCLIDINFILKMENTRKWKLPLFALKIHVREKLFDVQTKLAQTRKFYWIFFDFIFHKDQ